MSKRDKVRRKLRNNPKGVSGLEYYLSLPYTIEIIPDVEEGGYVARIRELRGCMTQADTWEELDAMILEAKTGWLEVALEYGHPIPEPTGDFANA